MENEAILPIYHSNFFDILGYVYSILDILQVCLIFKHFSYYFFIFRVKTSETLSIAMAFADFIYFLSSVTLTVTSHFNGKKLVQIWEFTETCCLHLTDRFWWQLFISAVFKIGICLLTSFQYLWMSYDNIWDKSGKLNIESILIHFNYWVLFFYFNGFAMLFSTHLMIFHQVFKTINFNIKNGNQVSGNLKLKEKMLESCHEINDVFGPGLLALVAVAGSESFYAVFIIVFCHGGTFKECLGSIFAIYNLCHVIHYAHKVTYEVRFDLFRYL